MEIDKSQIIDLLKSRGEQDKASQAESELPEKGRHRKGRRDARQARHQPTGSPRQNLPGGLGGLGG